MIKETVLYPFHAYASGQRYNAFDRRRICRIVFDRGMIAERQEKERGSSTESNLNSKFSKT